mgnify:CR=1 FL=1
MIKILNQYGIYNQQETIENSPHTFWLFHPWFDQTEIYITKFLDKILNYLFLFAFALYDQLLQDQILVYIQITIQNYLEKTNNNIL